MSFTKESNGVAGRRALVVGAGLGGTTAALALRQAGAEVAIFDKAPEFLPIGAALHLWTNAVRALQKIGVADSLPPVSSEVRRVLFTNRKGMLLADWDLDAIARKLGAASVGIRRPDLHAILVSALAPDVVQNGREAVGFRQDATSVTVAFSDGSEERGDLLIAADGLRSALRAQIHGAAKPRYAGYTAWRAIVHRDFDHRGAESGTFRLQWGRGVRFLFYRIGGERVYWEAIATAPEGQTDAPGTVKATVLERCRDFLDPVQAVIEATEGADVIRTDITDRDPLKRWGDGRVTLLGDAAHPMTHNLGQGGCQAIEDGIVLGKTLARATTIESGLRAYEAVRVKRSTRYVLRSRRIGALSKLESPFACAVRDRLLRHVLFKIGGRAQPREMAVEF
jgi:2-polyprenyl-6-methoxyphenol hydroxylase-like FAD-dependent oxidoreductase